MERFRRKDTRGFTLVELALVLVIIGLLITGVLKGEALIQNAKIKKLVNQKDSLTAAYYAFYDRYNVYPGDENQASIPPNDTHNGNQDGQITGNEYWYLFEDLVLAQIINGNYNGTANSCPQNPYGSWAQIQWNAALQSNAVVFNAIPYDAAEQIDMKYDDGIYNTGAIRANSAYTTQTNKILYWRM
ncbi:MAG TPA: prepilin-type N-terminal cleavage/methylation domain-containing protein [Deltaproteobacteria bacterium]|nr:prepilin-type N-terminal cleavage/methylation domain-containing protein [Deltaproteobacteria bacterium]HOM27972.1 prepilin-type N-terminal cleavage/methylation domain-containing protein [Deltaproteobacteria bacterium]HPP80877.1 prepilin-type N-terminal cleavage/methylation domain-containing protein [Deltaproteobacteria bacterium]